MLGCCSCPLKLAQFLSKQQFLNLSHHTPFEKPMKITPLPRCGGGGMYHTDVKRLKRPLEAHYKRLMTQFETNQSKNQGIVFFLVKDMFVYEQKQRSSSQKKPPRLNSCQHSAFLVSSTPPNFLHFRFC